MGEGARQQNLLLLRQGAALYQPVDRQRRLQLRQQFARLTPHLTPAIAQARLRQPIQHDVLRHAELRHQRHVHLLLHQMNAEALRVARRTQRHRLAVEQDLALIVGMRASQHCHQR